jgi:hypothetical protein
MIVIKNIGSKKNGGFMLAVVVDRTPLSSEGYLLAFDLCLAAPRHASIGAGARRKSVGSRTTTNP